MNTFSKKLLLALTTLSIILIPASFPIIALAQDNTNAIPSSSLKCDDNGTNCTETRKVKSPKETWHVIKRMINALSLIIVIIAVPMIIINRSKYVSYKYSNPEKATTSKEWVKQGVVGLVIVVLAQLFIYILPIINSQYK